VSCQREFSSLQREVSVPLQPGSAVFLLCKREKIPLTWHGPPRSSKLSPSTHLRAKLKFWTFLTVFSPIWRSKVFGLQTRSKTDPILICLTNNMDLSKTYDGWDAFYHTFAFPYMGKLYSIKHFSYDNQKLFQSHDLQRIITFVYSIMMERSTGYSAFKFYVTIY
jgi:hypothetical protein